MLASELLRRLVPDADSDDVESAGLIYVNGLAVVAGKSTTFDGLAAPGTTYPVDLPLRAGKTLVSLVFQTVIDTMVGTPGGNLNLSVGNAAGVGGPNANASATTNIAAATLSSIAALLPARISATGVTGPLPDMTTTPIVVRVNTNPTGLSALTGRVFMIAIYA